MRQQFYGRIDDGLKAQSKVTALLIFSAIKLTGLFCISPSKLIALITQLDF